MHHRPTRPLHSFIGAALTACCRRFGTGPLLVVAVWLAVAATLAAVTLPARSVAPGGGSLTPAAATAPAQETDADGTSGRSVASTPTTTSPAADGSAAPATSTAPTTAQDTGG